VRETDEEEKESKKRRNKIEIKKSQTEMKDKLIKK
jgi:hypothetical protein